LISSLSEMKSATPVMVMTKLWKATETGAKMCASVLFFRAILKPFHDLPYGEEGSETETEESSGTQI